MATAKKLIVNFFRVARDEDFLAVARELELLLTSLGQVRHSNRTSGIAQFFLTTELSAKEVEIEANKKGLKIFVGEEENDREMETV